jgi:hypothetical protein
MDACIGHRTAPCMRLGAWCTARYQLSAVAAISKKKLKADGDQ